MSAAQLPATTTRAGSSSRHCHRATGHGACGADCERHQDAAGMRSRRCTSRAIHQGRATAFDDVAQATPCTATGGFVEHEQPLILVQDRGTDPRDECRGHAGGGTGHRQLCRLGAFVDGRHANPLPLQHPPFRTGAPAIDAHFALADQPENTRARHGRQQLAQELIEPLAGLLRGNHMLLCGRFRAVTGFPRFRGQKLPSA